MTTSRRLFLRLPFWIAVSFVVAVTGFLVAGPTEDDAPPYDDTLATTLRGLRLSSKALSSSRCAWLRAC